MVVRPILVCCYYYYHYYYYVVGGDRLYLIGWEIDMYVWIGFVVIR